LAGEAPAAVERSHRSEEVAGDSLLQGTVRYLEWSVPCVQGWLARTPRKKHNICPLDEIKVQSYDLSFR
jgi:hypothetical protein